jgi:hypothetical protein
LLHPARVSQFRIPKSGQKEREANVKSSKISQQDKYEKAATVYKVKAALMLSVMDDCLCF